MRPVMYLIANSSVHMSAGKMAAQAAHAAVEAFQVSDPDLVGLWYVGGHYTKIVLEADDLHIAERYIRDRGFQTELIIDEGRTEFKGLTPTFIGVEIVDKDDEHVKATFGEFKLAGTRKREERKKIRDDLQKSWDEAQVDTEHLGRVRQAIERMKSIRF